MFYGFSSIDFKLNKQTETNWRRKKWKIISDQWHLPAQKHEIDFFSFTVHLKQRDKNNRVQRTLRYNVNVINGMEWHGIAWHKYKGIRIISCIDSNNYVMKNVCSIIYLDGISQTAKWWCTWSRNILLQHNAIVIAVVVVIQMHRVRDVICSTECVCVWICSMCVCVCPFVQSLVHLWCTVPHSWAHKNTNAVASTTSKRTNGRATERTNEQNERTYQNKRFKCTFPCAFDTDEIPNRKYFDAWDFSGVPALFV